MKTPVTPRRGGIVMAAVAVTLVGPTPRGLAAQQYPTRPPAPTALRPVRFPPFASTRLANGLEILIVENHEQPVISMNLTVRAGNRYEPDGKAGLADVVAELLTRGTARRSAEQIAAEVEGAGGRIFSGAGPDFLTVSVSGLAENLPQLVDILADVAASSGLPEAEFALARTRLVSNVRAELSQPASIADRIFRREVYGSHPYGRSETQESLRGLTREDAQRFYSERVRPAGALLVVAGDVEPARTRRLLQRSFAGWSGGAAPAPPAAEPPARTATEVVLVHKPGAVQSNIVAGFTFIRPTDPSFYALTLMNRVLGGGADARLFMILREQKGWTYGAYSTFTRPDGVGRFQATAEVRTEVTDSALGEMVRQLSRIREETVPDSEITNARNFVTGSFPLSIETPEQIAGQLANARLLGLGDDYVRRYRERVAAVSASQLRAAAERHVTTDRMVVVVVGDGPRVLDGLRALGFPVRIVGVEGQPMTEADLAPAAEAPRFEPSRITEGTQRYRILVQGNPFGEETRTFTRVREGDRDAWRMVTATILGPVGQQHDTTLVDATSLAPIRVRQGGRMAGQETFVRLDYADGRVRGQSRTPGGAGRQAQEHSVDTAVTAATLDENEFAAVMLALPFSGGGRYSAPVFSGGENAIKTYTLAVVGEESVTVPAGTFPCWKVELQGATTPVTFYVARDAPHVIVKLELTGMPLAFELTERTR